MTRKRPKSTIESARKRKVEAAIRHAEQVVKASGQTGPVLFRPAQPANGRSERVNNRGPSPPAQARAVNPAMEMAIRLALHLPELPAAPPAKPRTVVSATTNAPRPAAQPKNAIPAAVPARKKGQIVALPKTAKRPKKSKPAKATTAPKTPAAPKAKSNRRQQTPEAAYVRHPRVPAVNRKLGIAQNEEARRKFNARLKADAVTNASRGVSPFVELQRRWYEAFSYLQRFQAGNPDAPDVIAARQRLAEIEAEWERRQALSSDDPDYFPWPSTDAPGGNGSVTIGEWQEIGMLAYLGYRVGMTSTISAVQRAQLLKQIYSMRLPPLNGVTYMREWGAPKTGPRLRKIAEGLAAFARNAKYRKNPSLATAIAHWEGDLAQLKRDLYAGHHDFPWPAP